MGIWDIFYSEINRIRDKKESKEKMEKDIKKLLYKLIHRFSIDIEQYNQFMYISPRIGVSTITVEGDFYNKYREDFLSISVEVEPYIPEDLFDKLKKICLILQACKSYIHCYGAIDELKNCGEEVRQLALEIMSELKKEFK